MRPTLFLAAAASLVAAAPSISDACSPPVCWGGFFTPWNGATVPANLPAIYWRPMSGFGTSPADPSKVVLATAAAPTVPLPFTATRLPDGAYQLVPDQPLAPGTSYVLTDRSMCGTSQPGPTVTFQVAAAAPLPASLGVLAETENLDGTLEIATASGSCSSEVEAHVIGVGLQMASDAIAWRDVLHFETLVDGAVWRASESIIRSIPPGESWRGRGADRIYRVCRSDDVSLLEAGLAAGPHEVRMRATLPGSGTVVFSSSVAIDLRCADDGLPVDPDDTDDGGCETGRSGSSAWLLLLGAFGAIAGLRRRAARRLV